jgi:hypothetical protein
MHREIWVVGTFVIDWMTTGAQEPILTCPTLTVFVFLLFPIFNKIVACFGLTGKLKYLPLSD